MRNWQFCFLIDEYYEKFSNHGLMENKEEVDGTKAVKSKYVLNF